MRSPLLIFFCITSCSYCAGAFVRVAQVAGAKRLCHESFDSGASRSGIAPKNEAPPLIDTATLERAREKLDSQIVLALQQAHGLPPFDKPTQLKPDLVLERDGRVLVDIRAEVTALLLSILGQRGAEVVSSFPAMHTVRARVPLALMIPLTTLVDVRFIAPAAIATTNPKVEPGQ